jgi:hypothetical protein
LQQGTNVTLVDNGNGTVTINSTGGGGGGGGTVTSVALTVPSGFVVSGSPITGAGTLAITGAGTSADYIDGTGALQAFPFIPTQLDDLTDVYVSSPNAGETLIYDSVGSQFKNQPLATVATSGDYNDLSNLPTIPVNLDDLADVDAFNPTVGDVISWNGAVWRKGRVPLTNLSDVNISGPSNGQIIAWDSASNKWIAITPASGGSVTSVGLTMPAPLNPAFSVGGSPVTTAGTLAVTANGTSSQYVDGTGALQSFPALTGFVPYTGATQDVDLDANKLSAESVYIEGTNGAGHLHLKHQNADATASGQSTALWADNNGDIKWKNDGNYKTTLKSSGNTADRVYTFPNETAELMPRNAAITAATKTKITYDADGLVTAGADLSASDMPTGIDAANIGTGSVSNTEFGYLDGVTSAIQTQINNKKDTITYGQVYATTVGASTTVFAAITGLTTFNATETNRHFAVPVAGIVKNFYVKMSGTQSATGTLVITIRNNATSSAVTVTVSNADGASPTKSDNVNTLTVAAGDLIAIQLVNNATVTSASVLSMAFIIERT